MMCRKLKDHRGETLVEMLASILIAALAVALLFTCCMASVQMGGQARAADERYYENLSAAEARTEAKGAGKVKVEGNGNSVEVQIQLYGGDGMYSYQWGEKVTPVDP